MRVNDGENNKIRSHNTSYIISSVHIISPAMSAAITGKLEWHQSLLTLILQLDIGRSLHALLSRTASPFSLQCSLHTAPTTPPMLVFTQRTQTAPLTRRAETINPQFRPGFSYPRDPHPRPISIQRDLVLRRGYVVRPRLLLLCFFSFH